MPLWQPSDTTRVCLDGLVTKGLLYPLMAGPEWMLPGDERATALPDGHIVSFTRFHERGFTTPPH